MEAVRIEDSILKYRSSSPLAHLYSSKEDNICESMWDKSKVLVGTLWGIGQKLGNSLLSHTNPTPTPPHTKK